MNDDQFKIEQKLSESATTVVYRAFDEVLHRTVLLKVLHKHLANDADLRTRFVREARACAALRSEHIVQIYDLTEIDGAPAIVMEFVEGKSLKEVIAAGMHRNPDFARRVAVHVLRAVSLAHDRGIIHRDIKPGNILVSEAGTIKVTDFGLAAVALSPTVTMDGMVLGTPAYMAPEQVRGEEIDGRTDLFALGVTLVETLSGERIFEGSTYSECMKKVLAFRVDQLHRFAPLVTPDVETLLQRLLQPDKEKRFGTAREALNAIDEKKSSVFVRPIPIGRTRTVPEAAFSLALIVLILVGWYAVSPRGGNNPSVSDSVAQQTADSIKPAPQESPPVKEPERQRPQETGAAESIPTAERPTVTTAVPESATVYFTSSPWAKVYVNNRLIGETPIAKPVMLPAGTHTVMFSHPSFEPILTTVEVEPNREKTVAGNFYDYAGFLMCVVTPWAEVYVNEQYKDTTPLTKPIMLTAGKYSLRLKNSSFDDVVREITVTPKETTVVSINWTK